MAGSCRKRFADHWAGHRNSALVQNDNELVIKVAENFWYASTGLLKSFAIQTGPRTI